MGLIVASGFISGCATKGFVRHQVDSLRGEQAQDSQRIDKNVDEVRNSASQAMERAQIAYDSAGEAREIALGNLGLHEVGASNALFDFNSDELNGSGISALDQAAQLIQEHPGALVDIYGFADQTGDARYNLELGRRRADAVLRYLADKVPGNLGRFASVSYGEEKPVASNTTREGRAQNRRVMVSVLEKNTSAQQKKPGQESPSITS